MAWSLTNEQQANFRDHFLVMDKNHDGAVSLAELRSVMVDRYGVPEAEVSALFKVLVEAHDSEIHYSDFLAVMVCSHVKLDNDLLHTAFQKFDTKRRGYVNA